METNDWIAPANPATVPAVPPFAVRKRRAVDGAMSGKKRHGGGPLGQLFPQDTAGIHLSDAARRASSVSDALYGTIRLLLAAAFLVAGVRKLADPAAFAVVIDAFGLVPDPWIGPLSVALPGLEVLFAAGLLADVRGSLAGVALLLVLFLAVLGYGIWLGLDVDCGCFGPADPESRAFPAMRAAFYRDLAMMAGVGFLYGWRRLRGIVPVRPAAVFRRTFGRGPDSKKRKS